MVNHTILKTQKVVIFNLGDQLISRSGEVLGRSVITNETRVIKVKEDGTLLSESTGKTAIKAAIISSGESISNEIDLEDYCYYAFGIPEQWDAADISFLASKESDGTFWSVQDDAGVEVVIPVTAGKITTVDINALKLAPLRFIKIRSGTSDSLVDQTEDRVIDLILKN